MHNTNQPRPVKVCLPPDPLKRQIGGSHYKGFTIQPVEYIHQNNLGFLVGCIIKRIARYDQKGGKGVEDLKKINHELDLLIDQIKKGFIGLGQLRLPPMFIHPGEFCDANGFGSDQRYMITLVTLYNRGGGIEALYDAKLLIRDLIEAFGRSSWVSDLNRQVKSGGES